ncbi:MAG: glycine cleavage system protein GcvH [Pseudomonadota bacterium]
MRKFSQSHEWVEVSDDVGTVGITDYAQKALGDVVFVELPEVGKALSQGDEAAVVESVKAASEVYAPVSGTVVEANAALEDTPDTVNNAAEGDGWFFKLKLADTAQLDAMMDEAAYQAYVAELDD